MSDHEPELSRGGDASPNAAELSREAATGLERLHRRDTRLDNYVDRYAARTHGMTASVIRALFAVANRPEVVSLAGGMPNISDLPLDVVGAPWTIWWSPTVAGRCSTARVRASRRSARRSAR